MREEVTGILSFCSQVISSIAWPVTVLACVLLLRRQVSALVPLLRSVKYSDVEIHFGREVAELAKSAAAAALPSTIPNDTSNQWEDLTNAAKVRPRTAVRQAFTRVHEAMIELADRKQIEISETARTMPMVVGAFLLGAGAITTEQYDLLSKLRLLLDEAERAGPDSISTESAAEFINLAFSLTASFSR
jgi:hypothetical protein